MSTVAFIRRMLDAGFTHDDALRAAEAFEATAPTFVDEQAERRRAKDRDRKRLRNSAESAEVVESLESPLPLSPSPQTPLPHTPAPGDIYTRAKGPTSTEVARGFVAFWAAYPKRVGKDAAAKSFASAMKRIDAAEPLAVILAGLERALPGWDDPQFIPNPATWLNQGRWSDDAPQPRALGGPRNAEPDKLTARHDNYAASWSGAEQAAGILAARRAL